MIERIAIALLVLALGAAAGAIIWAVRRSRLKRARLGQAYYDASQATLTFGGRTVQIENVQAYDERPEPTEPVEVPGSFEAQLEVRVRSVTIPPAPLPRPPSPAVRRHIGQVAPRTREPLRSVYTPTEPLRIEPSGSFEITGFNPQPDPSPTPAADDGFKGGGGSFGGGGASGGWDPPADNGGGYSGDTGGSSDSGSSGSSGGNEAA